MKLQINAMLTASVFIALTLLNSCTSPQSTTESSSKSTSGSSVLPILNPQSPGQYKTVEINGAERRQGRYPQGVFGGTLIRSIVSSDPKVFNPWTATDSQSTQLASLMFRGLVDTDAYSGEIIPDLAAEFKVAPDKVTYTTRLRKGLKWSDGHPITAEDVAFTWNTIIAKGYGNSSMRDVTSVDGQSPKVTVVDELTNKFVTAKPFYPFIRQLSVPIAPKHIIEPIIRGKDGRKKFEQLWSATIDPKSLVTNGPFVLSRFVPSQRVEFVRTNNFYMVDAQGKQLPYLNKIIFQIVPDVNTNLLKFEAKEIDTTMIRLKDVVRLLKDQEKNNFRLYNLGQSEGTNFMVLNLNRRQDPKSHKPYVDPVKSEWFNDVNFRQALNHALNREQMVANYFKGIGFCLYTAEAPNSLVYDSDLKAFPQDIKYSESLLAKSGFQKKADGFLYDKKGHRVEFDLLAPAGGTFYDAIGGMMVDDFKKLGIKVNFQQVDFNMLVDKVGNSLNWEALLFALTGDPLEPNNGANVWKSDGRLHVFDQRLPNSEGKITVNDARDWELEIDKLFKEGTDIFETDKRKSHYAKYQEIAYEQVPFTYLVSPMVIIGMRNTVGNFDPTSLSQLSGGLHNPEEIYVKKQSKD